MSAGVGGRPRVEWADRMKITVNLIRAWAAKGVLEWTARCGFVVADVSGERCCDWQRLRGEARAEHAFEDEDVFLVIVRLGLRDLSGRPGAFDAMQLS